MTMVPHQGPNMPREHEFDRRGIALVGDARRWDAITRGAEFAVWRDPDIYPRIEGTDIHYVAVDPFTPGVGRLILLYRQEDDACPWVDVIRADLVGTAPDDGSAAGYDTA